MMFRNLREQMTGRVKQHDSAKDEKMPDNDANTKNEKPNADLGTAEAPYSLPGGSIVYDSLVMAFGISKDQCRKFYIDFNSQIYVVDASKTPEKKMVELVTEGSEVTDLETVRMLGYMNGYIDGFFKLTK